jgi:predicted ArsR family transcriptional regulator
MCLKEKGLREKHGYNRSGICLSVTGEWRMNHEQLAQEVHLSRPAVHEHIKRLQAKGILRGY